MGSYIPRRMDEDEFKDDFRNTLLPTPLPPLSRKRASKKVKRESGMGWRSPNMRRDNETKEKELS